MTSAKWDPRRRPPPDVCPRQFCWHWAEAGDRVDFSGAVYDDVAAMLAAEKNSTPIHKDRCACTFGLCTRLDKANGGHDWYEPDEHELSKSGLPWFYFIPDADSLDEEDREAYRRESADLWGTHADSDG